MRNVVARSVLAFLVVFGLVLPTSGAGAAELTAADRFALLDLLSRYSHRWDGRDEKGWVDLFTEDAVIKAAFRDQPVWSYGSNAERLNFIQTFYATEGKNGLLQSRHFQTNTLFSPQADGSVRADTMFAVTFQYKGEPAPRFSNTGIYRDRFVRTKSGWKFALRDILVDQELPAPAK